MCRALVHAKTEGWPAKSELQGSGHKWLCAVMIFSSERSNECKLYIANALRLDWKGNGIRRAVTNSSAAAGIETELLQRSVQVMSLTPQRQELKLALIKGGLSPIIW